ncbi:hypothetical protein A3G53_01250 [Candidatus Nomurabacteria bacterium RIFCSPLOWO2_12_FULL_44_11]|uniref:ATP-grasp domain-containing protein n=1 Tax=Candidatus Nomurabacteria bacterium RIFCSPLOWO2_12_FULL_44_11 TaxID=1801796 RepID=A0A1F6Y826_9BACT|nr:MAG: hypothetical protein A3E95_02555 [Candidatus Nomurabacteria bacterium RIFCSPHIGHO2_12_FULL_44_22b]OGJ02499.1 MAG: hypothetical protein A3G53_01250 [Candidatus Nomurabacteria bacterium RIFCSPLOWO2_12_FULL_44_11]
MKRVGILRGGKGKDYQKSIKEGGNLIVYISENLREKYKPVDIFIDKDGVWHLGGLPILPSDLVHKVDIVWNVAHPSSASILQSFNIPQINQSHFYSALENSREMLRTHLNSIGVNMTRYIVAPRSARAVHEKFPAPWVVKVGNEIEVVKTFDELTTIMNKVSNIIVEEFIEGKPSAVHVIPNFREEDIYVLPPDNLSKGEKDQAIKFTKQLHQHLGAKHYLKADFTLHPKRGFFLTNITSTPDLRPHSHLEDSLHSVGAKLHHLVEHMIESVS